MLLPLCRVTNAPSKLWDFTDKIKTVGAPFGGMVDVDQADIMPQRDSLFLVLTMNRVESVIDCIMISFVRQADILVGSKRALAPQTGGHVIEWYKLFFHDACCYNSQMNGSILSSM